MHSEEIAAAFKEVLLIRKPVFSMEEFVLTSGYCFPIADRLSNAFQCANVLTVTFKLCPRRSELVECLLNTRRILAPLTFAYPDKGQPSFPKHNFRCAFFSGCKYAITHSATIVICSASTGI